MTTERFHFTHNEVDFTLPYLTGLKAGLKADVLEAFSEAKTAPHKPFKAMFAVAALDSPEAVEAVRDMEDAEFSALIENWAKSTPGTSGK